MPFRILWTIPYLPWPTTSGGKLRQFQLIKAMALRGHKITLLIQSKIEMSADTEAALRPYVERLIVVPRRALKHPQTLFYAAFSKLPMLASINGYSPALEQTFSDLVNEHSFDIIQIEHSYGLQPFLDIIQQKKLPFVLTEHNVESRLTAATFQSFPRWMAPYFAYDTHRYAQWERTALSRPNRLVAVTEGDAKTMQEIRQSAVDVVINGVDCAYFSAVTPTLNRQQILFVGNMEYPPNVNAVEETVTHIMPLVWKQMPEATFSICGFAMPESWAKRWRDPRLKWTGFVPDIRDAQRESSVFIVALKEGGGSKLKVLEAMAAGLPIVSTVQGVSGLDAKPNQEYLLGDNAETLANALIKVLKDEALAKQIGESGRTYVQQHHDWSVSAQQLESIYQGFVTHANRD